MNAPVSRSAMVAGFLRSRRARLSPDPNEPVFDDLTIRRVPGLRREELAWRAGVSVDYYTKLEQGRAGNPSPGVLAALAEALRLTPLDRAFLGALFEPSPPFVPGPAVRRQAYDDLDLFAAAFTGATMVQLIDGQLRVRAHDERTRRMMFGDEGDAPESIHLVEYVFFDERSRALYLDWDAKADDVVGMVQLALAREPETAVLSGAIERAWSESEEFRARWQRFGITQKSSGVRSLRGLDGTVEPHRFATVAAPSDQSLRLTVYWPQDECSGSTAGDGDDEASVEAASARPRPEAASTGPEAARAG